MHGNCRKLKLLHPQNTPNREPLIFRILRCKSKLRCWFNLNLYRGISVSGCGGFRECSIFGGERHGKSTFENMCSIEVLQCVAVCCSVSPCVAVCCSVLRCVAVCCSVLQCVAVSCSVLRTCVSSNSNRRNSICNV